MDEGDTPVQDENPVDEGDTPPQDENPVDEGDTPVQDENPVDEGDTPVQDENPVDEGDTPPQDENPVDEGDTPVQDENPVDEGDTPAQDENPVDEGDTSVDQDASDNFPQENENTVNPDADDNSSEDNPQPILEGGSDNPDSVFPIGLLDLTQIDLDGDNQIDEKVSVNFSEITSEAVYNNSFGYYAIANINGAVKDTLTGELINPEEQGYAKAALNQRVENLELRRDTETQTWELSGGVMLVPYFIANGTVEEWMETNSDNQSENLAIAYFSFISANPDNKEHIRQVGDELRFEDLFGGGDNDFDDFVTRVNIPSVL